MAVGYNLQWDLNSDIRTLEYPKLSSVWWCLCYKNGKATCLRFM